MDLEEKNVLLILRLMPKIARQEKRSLLFVFVYA